MMICLQIWRMSDLIYRPEEEVLAELEKFKSHVISCASKPWEDKIGRNKTRIFPGWLVTNLVVAFYMDWKFEEIGLPCLYRLIVSDCSFSDIEAF